MRRGILAAVCGVVIGVYLYAAHSGLPVSRGPGPADDYYNLLVQGFRVGQLNLKKAVPPGLAQLADPYDPEAHTSYQEVGDMSYYKGKLYLYFGVAPAMVLFWPYVALTGHYLLQRDGIVVFCVVGFLVSTGLLWAVWRRYFAEVNLAMVAMGMLALGLATGAPLLLTRCEVYEVPITCGYALTMLTLATIWKALHEPEPRRRRGWLAAASLAYGFALGARPSLLFGAVILLVPVAQAWRERRSIWAPLLAATGPIALIGLGLMLYNALRYDSPFEFGLRYQLAGEPQLVRQFFSLRYLWFNFRVYFLEPVRWGHRFPFVHDIRIPTAPAGHGRVDGPFGVLTGTPLAWLALGVPLAWRGRSPGSCSSLRWFVTAVGLLLGICAPVLCLFFGASTRYEMDFLPELMLLAVVGILSVERALAPTSEPGHAGRPVWRRAVCGGWCLLLGFSVAFNLLASVKRCAEKQNDVGAMLFRQGKVQEAIAHYEQAVHIMPDYADAHYNLGNALEKAGHVQEAVGHYEQAVRISPGNAEAHNNLGNGFVLEGKLSEAISQYEQSLQIDSEFAEAHNNLGNVFLQEGKLSEAIGHYERALEINPDHADAHYNLAVALEQAGRVQEAIKHYEQALRIDPENAEAHNNLGNVLLQEGKLTEAIGHFEQALRIKPDFAVAHNGLGIALVRLGRVREAIEHWEQALRIKPDFVEAQSNLARARALP
jgi:tetratricopeptide (TPR) repeat protein